MIKFIKSATQPSQYYQSHLPVFCFLGRSNAGKSTLINALANSRIARTSGTPGRTQLINYFEAPDYLLVDLPGYGFAKLSKEQKQSIAHMNLTFLKACEKLKAVFQVCDANVITGQDQEMAVLFKRLKCEHFVILNKADKMSFNRYENKLKLICEYLQVDQDHVLLVSAKQHLNIDRINQCIYKTIQAQG